MAERAERSDAAPGARQPGVGFETDTDKVWILDASGIRVETQIMSKRHIAYVFLDEVAATLNPATAQGGMVGFPYPVDATL